MALANPGGSLFISQFAPTTNLLESLRDYFKTSDVSIPLYRHRSYESRRRLKKLSLHKDIETSTNFLESLRDYFKTSDVSISLCRDSFSAFVDFRNFYDAKVSFETLDYPGAKVAWSLLNTNERDKDLIEVEVFLETDLASCPFKVFDRSKGMKFVMAPLFPFHRFKDNVALLLEARKENLRFWECEFPPNRDFVPVRQIGLVKELCNMSETSKTFLLYLESDVKLRWEILPGESDLDEKPCTKPGARSRLGFPAVLGDQNPEEIVLIFKAFCGNKIDDRIVTRTSTETGYDLLRACHKLLNPDPTLDIYQELRTIPHLIVRRMDRESTLFHNRVRCGDVIWFLSPGQHLNKTQLELKDLNVGFVADNVHGIPQKMFPRSFRDRDLVGRKDQKEQSKNSANHTNGQTINSQL